MPHGNIVVWFISLKNTYLQGLYFLNSCLSKVLKIDLGKRDREREKDGSNLGRSKRKEKWRNLIIQLNIDVKNKLLLEKCGKTRYGDIKANFLRP